MTGPLHAGEGDGHPVLHIHIGNSDDRLTNPEWSQFCRRVADLVGEFVTAHTDRHAGLIGSWFSYPACPYQSAVFAVLMPTTGFADAGNLLIGQLREVAAEFGQDSIAVHLSAGTVFIRPTTDTGGGDGQG